MRSLAPALALLVAALSAVAAYPAAGVERAEPDGRNAAALSLLETAKQELNAGRAEQAAVTIERALRIDPQNPTLWHYLAVARRELGDATQADVMTAKSRSLTAPEPPARNLRDMADQLWSSARGFGQRDDDAATSPTRSSFAGSRFEDGYSDDVTAYDRSRNYRPSRARATPRDECRVVAGDRSWIVPCDEVQRYFSSSADSTSRRSSRAAAALERYYRRYGSSRLDPR
jgi:hypothetical protein